MSHHNQPNEITANQPAADSAPDSNGPKLGEEALRQSEEKYRRLFDSIDEAFCTIEVLFDDQGKAVDYRFLETNPAFLRQTGLNNVIGHRALDFVPELEPFWFDTYGHVAKTGEAIRFEHQAVAMNRYYDVYAFRVDEPTQHHVAVIFNDITQRKSQQQTQAFLLKLSDSLRIQPNADAIANYALQELAEQLQLDRCYVGVYRLAEDRGEFTHQVGNDRVPPVPDRVRLSDFPDALRVAFEGTLVIDDIGLTAGLTDTDRQNLGALGFSALVASTLRHGERNPLWSIVAVSARPRRWTSADIKLIDEVTERTWTAIERVNVEEALRLNEQRTRIQKEAFQAAINGEPLASSLNVLTHMVNPQLGTEVRTVFYLAYPDGASLHAIEGAGDMPRTYNGPLDGFPIGETSFCSGLAMATGRPVLTRDVFEDPLWQPYRQLATAHNFRACSSYPILTRDGKAVGSFALYFPHVHEAKAAELAIAEAVTQAAAIILSRHTEALERTRAQEALHESDEQFRTLVQNLPDYAIFRIDPDTIITEWTEGAQRIKGYTPEEAIGQPLSLFYTPENLAAGELTAEVAEATRTGRAERESVRIRKGGERFWVDEIMTAIRDEQGRLVGFSKISRDITERKKAAEALFDSRQRLQIVLDSIADHAIITTDPQGRIVSWNPGAEQMFGYPAEQAVGQSVALLFTPEDRAAGQVEGEMELARWQGQAPDERYHLRQDGSRLYVSGSLTPLYDADKTLLGYVKVARDLTDRQQMEQALREADRRKNEFLAMLAHELRNPLAPIRNGLQILSLTDGTNPELAPLVALMSRQLTHLVRLVDDLLDVSRISQGKIELKRERLELGTLVGGAVDAARPLYQMRGKTLELALSTGPLLVDGDATRLAQVVTNLLTNGSRYTGEDGRVRVSLESVQGQALLRIADNGIGLEAEQLEAIFELFVQVDNSVARSQGGLGLGLTLVKRLVELHGGRVEVRSAGLGQGSEFSVYLPLLSGDKSQLTLSESTPQPTSQPLLLVIDDNADAALTLAMLLKLKGYQVHTRSSGREGLEAAEQERPAAILLDIGMPDLDGYETCRLLRQQPWGKAVPVIALTGYGQAEDIQRTQAAGFNGHLVKPVDLGALTEVLTQLLVG